MKNATFKYGDSVRVVGNAYLCTTKGTKGIVRAVRDGRAAVDFSNDETVVQNYRNFDQDIPETVEIDVEDLTLDQVAVADSKTTLPLDSTARKNYPLLRGCLRYFPAALAGVAKISKDGNDKHNPGEEMHHARNKSADHGDCVIRHLIDTEDLLAALNRGDTSVKPEAILNEVSQLAWRTLALSQELHEKFGAPLAPGAKK